MARASIALLLLLGAAASQAEKPNVILIMADDLGYHDLSGYGHPSIKTPVLDRMAEEGVKLTSFHAGATVCTPSRMALLTGAYPERLGWKQGVMGYLIGKNKGVSRRALTMAEVFQAGGYRTGISGKWHLGDTPGFLPPDQGFETTFYIKRSNNQTKELWRGNELAQKPFDNRLLSEIFTREAIAFIKRKSDKPFFLYVPYTAPHFPVQAHPDWKGRSTFGKYGDVVEEMDHRIGEILATLKTEGIDGKTIVVFLSDNGPEPGTKESLAKPYRGRKWSALEGGTRVPCIVRWPGVVPAGTETDALVAAIDLLPTLAHACGIQKPEADHRVDGVNVWDTLVGRKGAAHPREDLLYWHGRYGFQAIRVGDWKLFPRGGHAGRKDEGTDTALYNLRDDPGETTNLAEKHPERVSAMKKRAEEQLADIRKEIIPLEE